MPKGNKNKKIQDDNVDDDITMNSEMNDEDDDEIQVTKKKSKKSKDKTDDDDTGNDGDDDDDSSSKKKKSKSKVVDDDDDDDTSSKKKKSKSKNSDNDDDDDKDDGDKDDDDKGNASENDLDDSDKKSSKKSKGKGKQESEDKDTSGSQPKVPIYRLNKVDFASVELSEINKTGPQPLSYINYNDSALNAETKLLFQVPMLKITSHGIPRLNPENTYYDSYDKLDYIKVPLDDKQKSCRELRAHATAADEYFGSDEVKKKLFGKRADDYEYQTCVRTPQDKDDDDDDDDDKKKKNKDKGEKKEYPKIDYIKFKLNTIKQGKGDKAKKLNKTKLVRVEGKKRVPVKAENIKDVVDEVTYQSDIKFIGYYTKVWINKAKAQGAAKKMYGVGLKIMAIEYIKSISKGSIKPEQLEMLSDDEDDDDNDNEEVSPKDKKSKDKKKSAQNDSPKKKKSKDDDDDDAGNDDDNNDEDDDNVKVKNSKKKSKSSKKDR